jgi:hypothetical protein
MPSSFSWEASDSRGSSLPRTASTTELSAPPAQCPPRSVPQLTLSRPWSPVLGPRVRRALRPRSHAAVAHSHDHVPQCDGWRSSRPSQRALPTSPRPLPSALSVRPFESATPEPPLRSLRFHPIHPHPHLHHRPHPHRLPIWGNLNVAQTDPPGQASLLKQASPPHCG